VRCRSSLLCHHIPCVWGACTMRDRTVRYRLDTKQQNLQLCSSLSASMSAFSGDVVLLTLYIDSLKFACIFHFSCCILRHSIEQFCTCAELLNCLRWPLLMYRCSDQRFPSARVIYTKNQLDCCGWGFIFSFSALTFFTCKTFDADNQ
jgi:hypothetical protein